MHTADPDAHPEAGLGNYKAGLVTRRVSLQAGSCHEPGLVVRRVSL